MFIYLYLLELFMFCFTLFKFFFWFIYWNCHTLCAGIMFQDITTLLLDPKAFKDTIDLFVERYKGKNISVVAGKKQEDFFLLGIERV